MYEFYFNPMSPMKAVNDAVDAMETFYDMLDEIDLSDFDGYGMEFNMSTACNDNNLELGINYKDSNGNTFNNSYSGNSLSDVVDQCFADFLITLFDLDEDEIENEEIDNDKQRIAELEARIAELEADLNVARIRNEKNVDKKYVKKLDKETIKNKNKDKCCKCNYPTWKGFFGV